MESNIATAREYLSVQQADPWADYWVTKQTPTNATKVIKIDLSNGASIGARQQRSSGHVELLEPAVGIWVRAARSLVSFWKVERHRGSAPV